MVAIVPIVAFITGVIVGAVLGITSYRRQLHENLSNLGYRRVSKKETNEKSRATT
jgi:hypothetical protein